MIAKTYLYVNKQQNIVLKRDIDKKLLLQN
jgi:hypothetical protein